ncbi:MAG: divergent PAP2 family protein [Bacillota bacterium]|nr:divergent PAP2 family protein [Bacillota bacterium]
MTVGSVVTRILSFARHRLFYILAVMSMVLWGGPRFLPVLFHDRYILSSLLSVFCSQGMKPFTAARTEKDGFAWGRAFRCGGMPSSHAAVAAALTTSLGIDYGWNSPFFQIAAVLGGIVIYDAVTLRRVVGEHSRLLKEMIREKTKVCPLFGEMVGHTLPEASVGILIGVLCAVVVVWG